MDIKKEQYNQEFSCNPHVVLREEDEEGGLLSDTSEKTLK